MSDGGRGGRRGRGRGRCGGGVAWAGLGAAPRRCDVQCAVCRGLLCRPAALPCGHRFCLACVQAAGPACPLCRRRAGAWRRRAEAQGRLVDEPLWAYIQQHFSDPPVESEPVPAPAAAALKLSAPGEIRSEYRAELEKVRIERRLSEEKYSSENQKLIRELQEREKIETESRNALIENDEKLARELSMSSDLTDAGPTPLSTPLRNGSNRFYEHLEKKSDKRKSRPLDKYLNKTDGNGGDATSKLTTAASPELISTAGRCGRFIKQFFNGKLWGAKDESEKSLITSAKVEPEKRELDASFAEPNEESLADSKNIEEKNNCPPSKLCDKDEAKKKECRPIDLESESEDSLAPDLCYFKPIQPLAITRSAQRVVKCLARKKLKTVSSDVFDDKNFNIDQTRNSLEKLKGSAILNTYSDSAFVCLLTVPTSPIKVNKTPSKTRKKSPKKRSSKACNNSSDGRSPHNFKFNGDLFYKSSNFNGKLGIPKINGSLNNSSSVIDEEKEPEANKMAPDESVNPRRSRRNKISQSCIKLDSHRTDSIDFSSKKLKRSLSFNNPRNVSIDCVKKCDKISTCHTKSDKKSTSRENNNDIKEDAEKTISKIRIFKNGAFPKNCDNNGHGNLIESDSIKIKKHTNGYTNGDAKNKSSYTENGKLYRNTSNILHDTDRDLSIANLDPSILEEQKYIENMIMQEKKDHDIAKKLQRQMGGTSLYTGYTIRTAAKRQATITELLTTPKKMKI